MQEASFFNSSSYCKRWGNTLPFGEERTGICYNAGVGRGARRVRPFVAREVIARCYSLAAEKQAVVPVTDVVETVRHLVGEGSETVSRDEYKLVQTPQVFDADLLKQAYGQPYTSHFTDDASVVEALGKSVYLTEGNRENIKITTPFDLKIATALLESCSI